MKNDQLWQEAAISWSEVADACTDVGAKKFAALEAGACIDRAKAWTRYYRIPWWRRWLAARPTY